MKQLTFLLGKIFLFTAVPFGLAMVACYIVPSALLYLVAIASGKEPVFIHLGWGMFLVFPIMLGALFGIPMALILGPAHYYQVKKIAKGKPFDLSPIQQRVLVSDANPAIVFEHCLLALQRLPARITEQNAMNNYITARTKVKWKTWGDVIRIDVVQQDDNQTEVKIVCRPSLKSTLVDYGRNYENAEKLLSFLRGSSPAV